ncbi:MAG: hypothetical protein JOZ53_20190 [Planctomycetaceae bacterium]|nr:hypothetical protein [Planctomycetaceae bacterium]
MKRLLIAGVAALATTLGIGATSAQARYHGGHYRHHGGYYRPNYRPYYPYYRPYYPYYGGYYR